MGKENENVLYRNPLNNMCKPIYTMVEEKTTTLKNGKTKNKKVFINEIELDRDMFMYKYNNIPINNLDEVSYIIAIDPANLESGVTIIDYHNKYPIYSFKKNNKECLKYIKELLSNNVLKSWNCMGIVIEMVASYGMPVGKTVFDTCVEIGKFTKELELLFHRQIRYITRNTIKNCLCHSSRAKDSNVRQVLIDTFGDVGTKDNKGWFYGFAKDIWASYAVGIAFLKGAKEYMLTCDEK